MDHASPHGAARDCRLPPGWDSRGLFRSEYSRLFSGLVKEVVSAERRGITAASSMDLVQLLFERLRGKGNLLLGWYYIVPLCRGL